MTHPSNAWMRLASGRYVDLNHFTKDDVDIEDIATSLSRQVRFSGHARNVEPLTVLQHSMLMATLCPKEAAFGCLLHDAHEAYLTDIPSPVKTHLGVSDEGIVSITVRSALNVSLPPRIWDIVKMYDLISLDIERRAMWPNCNVDDRYWPRVVHSFMPHRWFHEAKSYTKHDFLDLYEKLR